MQFAKTIIHSLLVTLMVSGCGITPNPISEEDIADFALTDISEIYKNQAPLPEVLTLSDVMARSLKYNLENRVKLMEQAIAHKSVEMAELDMLPMLGVSAGYFDRTNQDASSSNSIITNQQSLEPSTSIDRSRYTADIRFTWNALDFGVSYLQAVQNSERFLISQKSREKVMLKLLQQVRSAYWRVVVMQKLSEDVNAILKRVNLTLDDLKSVREQQLFTPLFVLNDIRLLVDTKKQLEELKESIINAKVELAVLINVPSNTDLILEMPCKFNNVPVVPGDIDEMELTALMNSTDYTSEIYNVRIDRLESRKSLLRLLPGIEFSYSGNYASNSFLVNNLWGELGVRLVGDLLKLAVIPDLLDYAEISEHLAVSRRLAVNTAVVAGVHLAWQNYNNSINRLTITAFLNDIDREIAALTRNAEKNRSSSEVEAIQAEFRAFSSEIGHLSSYAQAQDSFGA
ncbi:MAG: TolC family protein, partial [Thiotrichaceae bacterium]|nr:TolC family protein [Thiotrichaceae bacterium]